MIQHTVLINAPAKRCFDLTRSIDFHVVAAKSIGGKAVGGKTRGLSELGDRTIWTAKFFGISFKMEMEVVAFVEDRFFSEEMVSGMPKDFAHEYRVESSKKGVSLTDRLSFGSRFGILGSAIDSAYMKGHMTSLVVDRLEAIKTCAESDEWRNFVAV